MTNPSFLYRHFDADGTLLYVGISNNVGRRTDDHSKHSGWFSRICKIEVILFETRQEALLAERDAIVSEKPLFNVHHKKKDYPAPPAVQISLDNLIRSVVFKPLYDICAASEVLGLSQHRVRAEIANGNLGTITLLSVKAQKPKTYITGWQLIDWLESQS